LPPPGAEIMANIDPIRFGQVIHNLLSNAIKFSRPDGTIQIDITEATMTQGRRANDPVIQVPAWRIAVIDEGVGIPEAELDAVFDKFVQSSKTTTGAGGTGLGLSISKEIIEAHRGQIRAYNRNEMHGDMRDNDVAHLDQDGSGGAVFEILIPRDRVSQGPI
jgi:signal transduction histidine kinase